MEEVMEDIIAHLRSSQALDEKGLSRIILAHNRRLGAPELRYPKKQLLPYYLKAKRDDPERWARWGVDPGLEQRLVEALRMKPRRTASGVATVSVLTKPWPCSSDCLYCPNDIRMPKSYLSDEPACQRAERSYFDPYLQATSRLKALADMGHAIDKVEMIILGGTWDDYPLEYRTWFVGELFRAANDGCEDTGAVSERLQQYVGSGIANEADHLARIALPLQQAVDSCELSYNQAMRHLYLDDPSWQAAAVWQQAGLGELAQQQEVNESATHRVVGLSVETRPDKIDVESLTMLRVLGCTKVQMGIQSLDLDVLAASNRDIGPERIALAFDLLRLFGFKTHVHLMLNLPGSTPEQDLEEYRRLVTDPAYMPDEVKLYPCVLVASARLASCHAEGSWQPYSEEQMLEVLTADMLGTPPYTRISRMVRDISAKDIMAGSKKANLRQFVEAKAKATGRQIAEMRYREVATGDVDTDALLLSEDAYLSASTEERFLSWLTADGRLVGFIRLSLPSPEAVAANRMLPVREAEAMIRELHIYGSAARIGEVGEGPQHLGLGRRLVEEACAIARQAGYAKINVISSVGTRRYYRGLGFADRGLYQTKVLD
jgi:elongator complex protein 3